MPHLGRGVKGLGGGEGGRGSPTGKKRKKKRDKVKIKNVRDRQSMKSEVKRCATVCTGTKESDVGASSPAYDKNNLPCPVEKRNTESRVSTCCRMTGERCRTIGGHSPHPHGC